MNSKKSDWLTPVALLALSLVPAVAGTVRLSQLASGANITPEKARFFERLLVGSAMFASIALAVRAIWARDFITHGEWMMRAYAIGLGAGTQVFTHLP